MIYRTKVFYRAPDADLSEEHVVFIDESNGVDKAAQRLVKLLTMVWECPESSISFAGPFDEDYWRKQATRPDAGDQFLFEEGSQNDQPVYCRDPLLLVGPRSMARLRAAREAIQRPPTAAELDQPAGIFKTERRLNINGDIWLIPPYLAKHRPQNQFQVEGIPVNPTLRWGFGAAKEIADPVELQDWWQRPYIVIDNWWEREAQARYRRACELEEGVGWPEWPNLEPREKAEEEFQRRMAVLEEGFEWDMTIRKTHWYECFPEGVRYTVECWGATGWKTCTGDAASLADAVKIARGEGEGLHVCYHELTQHIPDDLKYLTW